MRHPFFYAFRAVTKPFIGSGLGKIRPIGAAYRSLSRRLIPQSEQIIQMDGFKIRVRVDKGRDIDGVAQKLIYDHEYEPMTTAVFKRLLKPGMTVVDVGANIGYFTLLSSHLVKSSRGVRTQGQVFAFEPDPKNYAELSNNSTLNHQFNIVAAKCAIGHCDGPVTLHQSPSESGAHSLINARPESVASVVVDCRTLDSLPIGTVDLLKTDTEGNDYNVLLGAAKLLGRSPNPVIIVECWEDGLRVAGKSTVELLDLLGSMGFTKLYAVDEFKKKIVLFDLFNVLWYQRHHGFSINIVASRNDLTEKLGGLLGD